MNFNTHYKLNGMHAFLGASNFYWIRYDDQKLADSYYNRMATLKGTELHTFAAQCIKLGQKLPKLKKTLNLYVNDAIGFRMVPEQILYYSDNCFGTTDAISFRDMFLRIHDYKSGVTPAHMEQLMIYAALFCLEYGYDPHKIKIELRIYQNNEALIHRPDGDDVKSLMNRIVSADAIINKLKQEEG